MKKLIKRLKSETFQRRVLQLITRYNFFLFPFFWSLTLFFSILESFIYSGFVHKYIFFGFQFFFLFTILGGLLIRSGLPLDKTVKGKWIDYYKILAKLNNLAFPVILSATLITSAVEKAHYRNYVFSKIHLQPQNLFWVCFVSFSLVILDIGNLGRIWFLDKAIFGEKIIPRLTLTYLKRIVVLALVFWVLIFNVRFASSEIFKNFFFILRHPFASYDEKMKGAWGDVYNYMLFIKQNTPDNAVIANPPPIKPWNNEGSGPLVTAFLYPRIFVQDENDENKIDLKADYALIAWGWFRCSESDVGPDDEDCHGWPRVKVPAEWIIYKKENSTEITKRFENTIYDPQDDINKYTWGLIKIKKE